MALANTEIVHEGWLIKSPPTKRIWRAKWRRRWFVLKHSGELPGQYFLEYYTDRTCRKLKGKIDLDQCEQVDSGLTIESRKQRYANMFDIRTPKRVYFLAADSESDMNSWVGCICHVCGLKVFYREDEETGSSMTLTRPPASSARSTLEVDTPPTSPTSPTGSSGPYFPLSECLSGSRSLFFNNEMMASMNQPSSAPVTPAPTRGMASGICTIGTQSLRGKPRREDWDLFYDQPRHLAPASTEFPEGEAHDSVRGFEEKFARSFKKLLPGDGKFVAPPRPPKPAHLTTDHPSHNYLNLEQISAPKTPSRSSSPRSPPSISPLLPTPTNPDAWYDFPRSHQGDQGEGKEVKRRHCYTNAAPGEMNQSAAEIFTFNGNTPTSLSSAPTIYSNLQSPFPVSSPGSAPMTPFTPPSVNRTLKPKKVGGVTMTVEAAAPPSVNRQLKPHRPVSSINAQTESHGSSSEEVDEPSSRGSSRPNSAHEEQIFYYVSDNPFSANRRLDEIQYLDLDLESDSSLQSPKSPERVQHQTSSTVYKTVDFWKTEAFNRTRLTVEECRYKKTQ